MNKFTPLWTIQREKKLKNRLISNACNWQRNLSIQTTGTSANRQWEWDKNRDMCF